MTPCTLRVAVAVALGALASARARAESSIGCSGGIVQVGDAKLDLLAKCGRPALQEQFSQGDAVFETLDGQPSSTPSFAAERWTYNFGSSRFLQIVTLEGGKIVAIERGGYGYPPELLRDGGTGRARCESAAIRVGDRKLDLLAKCGRPASREVHERRSAAPPFGAILPPGPTLDVETWTYDFGPQQFRSIVTLENGAVVRIERGPHGTAR
jgi:hypothetical protein